MGGLLTKGLIMLKRDTVRIIGIQSFLDENFQLKTFTKTFKNFCLVIDNTKTLYPYTGQRIIKK